MAIEITYSEAALLERVVDPKASNLSVDAAQALLELKFTPDDLDRLNELSAKVSEGTLDSREQQELDGFLLIGHLIDLMHSKARLSLRRLGESS